MTRFEFIKDKLRVVFHRNGKRHTHDWDISGLGVYVDEQSPEIMQDLINEGDLKSRINIMTAVKGSEEIKLISSEPSLQSASACGWTATGGMILTDKAIATVRVKIQEEYCNEDLNDTWAQLEQRAGANEQDTEPPSFADAMLVYYQARAQELDENLMMNGDTTSLDSNLVYYDGFSKLWDADALFNIAGTPETEIDNTNAFAILQAVYNAMPTIVKRHKTTIGAEIICGFETAQKVRENIWNDKDFQAELVVTEPGDGTISFILPTTNMTVRSVVTLDGTEKVYGVCYNYMFYGTDLENDKDGFTWKFSDFDELLRFGVKWRAGIQYVFSDKFTRLTLTPTS